MSEAALARRASEMTIAIRPAMGETKGHGADPRLVVGDLFARDS